MRTIYIIQFLIVLFIEARSQKIDIVYGDPSIEQVLEYTSFVDSISGDSLMDLVRIDHVGTGTGSFLPLVISVKTVRMKHRYEYISLRLDRAEMEIVARYILSSQKEGNPAKPSVKFGVFRICYRIGNLAGMFFVPNASAAKIFFDRLQNHVKEFKSEQANLAIIRYRRGAGGI